ncbi:MAG: Rpn family recombination-promoting nuclease/putative transposase [Desulfobacteria bacterium]
MINKITSPHDKFFKQVFARWDAAKEFMMKYLPPSVVW